MKEIVGKERPTDLNWSKVENVFIDAPVFDLYEKAVILKLMRHAKEGGNSAHPSKKTISLTTGIGESKLRYVFRGLEEKRYVWAEARKHADGRCNSNIYYWDKEKILKDSLVSCLENNLIKESEIPRLWMQEIALEKKIKQVTTPHHMRGDPSPHDPSTPHHMRGDPSPHEGKEEEEEEETKEDNKGKKNSRPLVLSSSPVSHETEKPKTSGTHKEQLESKKLERIQDQAHKIKNQLESEGYRRQDLDFWFDSDIENREINNGKGNRLHFLDTTARSYQANLAKGIDEWQVLITKFEEKYHKACDICGKEMKTEACLNCESTPSPIFTQEPILQGKERELQEAKDKLKELLERERVYSIGIQKEPDNKIIPIMLDHAKNKIKQKSEKLLDLLSSAAEYNQVMGEIKAEVEQEDLVLE